MRSTLADRWLWRARPPVAESIATLLVLPHAGGSAQAYAPWSAWLPAELDVFVAQYPGRGARFGEPSADSVEALAEAIAEAACEIAGPLVMLGHSLGGLVGFEAAWRLQQRGRALDGFLPSASTPPHLFRRSWPPAVAVTDDELLAQLQRRGGLPADVMEHPDLLEMLFEVLREDIRILDSYEMVDASRRLDCPVCVLGGTEDPVSTPERVARWQDRAKHPIRLRLLPGGHFYIDEQSAALATILREDIAGWTGHPVAATDASLCPVAQEA